MQKVHWAPIVIASAIGLALTAIPSKPAFGDGISVNTIHAVSEAPSPSTIKSEAMPTEGGEIIHGVIFLALVMFVVAASRILKNRN